MNHDPYCPAPRDWWRTCICNVLAKVRAKALNDAVEAVMQVPGTTVIPDGDEWQGPRLIERSKVIAAIRDLQVQP